MSSKLEALAAALAESAKALSNELEVRQLPSLSLEEDHPSELQTVQSLAATRSRILDIAEELQALVLGPVGLLTTPPHNHLLSLQTICRFNLFAQVPVEENASISYGELARATCLDEGLLRRILRHAITNRIFKHSESGLVQHSIASRRLASDKNLRQWINLVTEELWPAATRTVDALKRWPSSQEPTETGFNIAFNTTQSFFEEVNGDDTRLQRFNEALSWQEKARGTDIDQLVVGFDWESLGDSLLVDVGGSDGVAAVGLAEQFRHLHCVVQDLPSVIEGIKKRQPLGTDRVRFMSHDFFHEQPVSGEVYLFRNIFHDWSDKYACMILRALIPALKYGAKILVNDYVMEEAGNDHSFRQQALCTFDLSMLQLYNGCVRTVKEWCDLFKAADERFQMTKLHQTPGTRISLLEFSWTAR